MAPTELKYTALDEIEKIHATLSAEFLTGKSRDIKFRKQQLASLAYLVKDNIERFEAALKEDLGRPVLETHALELAGGMHEAVDAYNHVKEWAKTEDVPWSLNYGLLGPKIRKEPKGVVLIISAFNYPLWLCLSPLSGAIAAGNAVVVKCSEFSKATSSLLAELLPKYLDPSLYAIVNGGVAEATKLLDLKWDHIMYTGNGRVARIVSAAAAKHLTPLTLELGGKNPVFIDPKTDLTLAARRTAWGKFSNAGQTCTAPDYVLIPAEAQDKFVQAFTDVYKSFYPEGALHSDSLSRIISDEHFKRIKGLLDNTKGTVVLGGETEAAQRFIAPTVVRDVSFNDSLMSEEIFGPVLPIVPVKDLDEAIQFVNAHDHPLGLYVFSPDPKIKKKIFDSTRSGAAVANDVTITPIVEGLPFGGVGGSGYGSHTGKYGFDTFTHFRGTFDSPKIFDLIMNIRYPPYTKRKLSWFQMLLNPIMPPRPRQLAPPAPGSKSGSWFSNWMYVIFGRDGSLFNFFVYVKRLLSRGRW